MLSTSVILARPYNTVLFATTTLPTKFDMEILGFFSLYATDSRKFLPIHFLRFQVAPARKVCIIRGIGYRVQLFNNFGYCADRSLEKFFFSTGLISDTFSPSFLKECLKGNEDTDWNAIETHEFPSNRYLSLRVGHSDHLYFPIPNFIGIKISKKDRKLVVYGFSTSQVSTFTKFIHSWRPPSVYTGRGIRYKKLRPRRKLGKKDIRKGRFF